VGVFVEWQSVLEGSFLDLARGPRFEMSDRELPARFFLEAVQMMYQASEFWGAVRVQNE